MLPPQHPAFQALLEKEGLSWLRRFPTEQAGCLPGDTRFCISSPGVAPGEEWHLLVPNGSRAWGFWRK